MGFSEFIRERQFLSNVSPSTLNWYKCSFKWLDSESPTQQDLKNAVLKMRVKGLRATGCNSAIRAINAYVHWASAGPDVDSVHPKDSMATDQEHAEARKVADQIIVFLTECGWPQPILVDSGNGYQIHYKANCSDPYDPFWETSLSVLAEKFNTSGAVIDKSVHNPARLGRMPFTWNMKGVPTTDRPHRFAKVISYPEKWDSVPPLLVQHLAELNTDVKVKMARTSAGRAVTKYNPSVWDSEWELLLNAEGIAKLFEEFPTELQLLDVLECGEEKKYLLSFCPFSGYRHQNDPRHTALIYNPAQNKLTFKCLADQCSHLKLRDLLQHLDRATGHRFSQRIWKKKQNVSDERADCECENSNTKVTQVAVYTPSVIEEFDESEEPFPTRAHSRYRSNDSGSEEDLDEMYRSRELGLLQTAEWKYDSQTWRFIASIDWSQYPTDPKAWGVPDEDVVDAWYDWERQSGVMRKKPSVLQMAKQLGPDCMYLLAKMRTRPLERLAG